MELESLVRQLTDALARTFPHILQNGPHGLPYDYPRDTHFTHGARRLWSLLRPEMAPGMKLRILLETFAAAPEESERRIDLERAVQDMLRKNRALSGQLESVLSELTRTTAEAGRTTPKIHDVANPLDESFKRLEVLKLLRLGMDPGLIARRFKMDVSEVYQINKAYSMTGLEGAILPRESIGWIDQLNEDDPLLRRIEMVRLLRSGTPAYAVAQQFTAIEDYVLALGERFTRYGLPGIMTEEDVVRFHSVNRRGIRICSYNLQGIREDDPFRFRRMAREISDYRPDLLAFQEVVNGAGIADTGDQVARWLSAMTGEHYNSRFTYCHQFMEKYPEGVAICTRTPVTAIAAIDLTNNLRKGLRPSMDRRAQMIETTVSDRKIILACVHLDHAPKPEVRLVQVEKLLTELDNRAEEKDYHALVLAGDFNDTEESPAIKLLKTAGFRDAYRVCHKSGGNTFAVPTPEARIDYIFVKGRAEVVSAEVILNNSEFSDHLGVIADLK